MTFEYFVVAVLPVLPATIAAFATWRKAQVIVKKTEEIHHVTNSHLTKVQQDLADANAKIAKLEDLMAALLTPSP